MSRILVIGYVWPEPKSSAAGKRMMQLLELFLSRGHELIFSSTATPTPYQADLKAMGIAVLKIELNSSSFDDFLKEHMPDMVLYDRFMMEEQFGWRVRKTLPDALQILDTEDLHFLRKARQQGVTGDYQLETRHLQSALAKREIASIYRSDLSLIISSAEMQMLKKNFGLSEQLLYYLPLLRKKEIPARSALEFQQRQDFVSLGNFLHAPNWDAVLQLKRIIWPLIRKQLPQTNLFIYGAYPSQKVHQLHNEREGFLVKGRAESAKTVLEKSRVLLAPLRFGAGIKGKFLDAMEAGTPSVTTTMGAEGMAGNLPWAGEIADSSDEFAAAAVRLYSKRARWEQAQSTGFKKLERDFPDLDAGIRFMEHAEHLTKDLRSHRERNFIGQMLQHHFHDSTRFLSKYIEAKNNQKP